MSERQNNRFNSNATSVTVGYEVQLWQKGDARGDSMDAGECEHVVLGRIFCQYISDAFDDEHAKLEAERAQGAGPEDPDEYRAVNIFWVPRTGKTNSAWLQHIVPHLAPASGQITHTHHIRSAGSRL